MNPPANPPLPQKLVELLETPSTATLTSVLNKHGLWNVFIEGVSPLRPGNRMIGRAFTLRYIPAREDLDRTGIVDNLTDIQRIAVERIGLGDILVIDARGDTRAGTMGAILATRIQQRGAVGVVTDGAFRDSPVIATLDMPAYCRARHASTNKTIHHPLDYQQPIACGGVAVYPGDVLVGDDEGVVVIPADIAAEVAQEAADMERLEEFILDKIRQGIPLPGIYPPGPDVIEEYQSKRGL